MNDDDLQHIRAVVGEGAVELMDEIDEDLVALIETIGDAAEEVSERLTPSMGRAAAVQVAVGAALAGAQRGLRDP